MSTSLVCISCNLVYVIGSRNIIISVLPRAWCFIITSLSFNILIHRQCWTATPFRYTTWFRTPLHSIRIGKKSISGLKAHLPSSSDDIIDNWHNQQWTPKFHIEENDRQRFRMKPARTVSLIDARESWDYVRTLGNILWLVLEAGCVAQWCYRANPVQDYYRSFWSIDYCSPQPWMDVF